MKKQTAVEWLVEQLNDSGIPLLKDELEFINKAKAMEKEQIMESFKHGELPPLFVNYNAEQYYNETYKSE